MENRHRRQEEPEGSPAGRGEPPRTCPHLPFTALGDALDRDKFMDLTCCVCSPT